ncbi:hypothetical protein BH11BAC2_BH11BAC2_26070 [soil metagenome]
MYTISESQIEFILNDIRRNGIELEDLQQNLLDHICCIIENEFVENGDFEQFYYSTARKFYKNSMREIENETISLLIHKNYYIMKKIMIGSGITSVALLSMGIILKFLHQPGASFGIVLGIVSMSLIFLPLMITLRIKEKKETKDKVLVAIGAIAAITMSMGVLFKVMYWPGANMMGILSVGVLFFVFLPIYFFTGIRNPETKINTIVSSLLIITGCGLFLTLVRSPYGSRMYYIQNTKNYLRNEQLLANEENLLRFNSITDSQYSTALALSKTINSQCESLKSFIIQLETGKTHVSPDFEKNENWLGETKVITFINDNADAKRTFESLRLNIDEYNKTNSGKKIPPIQSLLFESVDYRSTEALNGIIQIQLYLLQNERAVMAQR